MSDFQVPNKFSKEELQVLSECNTESFYQRSLPISSLLGFSTFAGIRQGYFKASPKFGVFPKVTFAVIMGYFIGKISYQEACAEKLMALPGSYIGQLLRDRKEGKMGSFAPKKSGMLGAGPDDIYSDAGPGNSLDLDTDRPLFNEDAYNSSSKVAQSTEPGKIDVANSYDELRRKNRGDYSTTRQDPYRTDAGIPPPISRPKQSPEQPQRPPSTNKYGDIMD